MTSPRNSVPGLLRFVSVLIILVLPGCKPAPPAEKVRDLIVKHFETEKYHVIEIDIGGIRPLAVGEITYMGTPGYVVDVKSITLEVRQDIRTAAPLRKGQYVTFTNARVRIREQPVRSGQWILSDISGIPVP